MKQYKEKDLKERKISLFVVKFISDRTSTEKNKELNKLQENHTVQPNMVVPKKMLNTKPQKLDADDTKLDIWATPGTIYVIALGEHGRNNLSSTRNYLRHQFGETFQKVVKQHKKA